MCGRCQEKQYGIPYDGESDLAQRVKDPHPRFDLCPACGTQGIYIPPGPMRAAAIQDATEAPAGTVFVHGLGSHTARCTHCGERVEFVEGLSSN